jgi:hypothetical protein
LLAQLACKHALPRLLHALQYVYRTTSLAQTSELVQGVREVRRAVELLARAAAAAAAVAAAGTAAGTAEAAEAAATAGAAELALRRLLMMAAYRLEGAVDDTCIPPCFADAAAVGVAGDGSVAAAAIAAAAAAARRLQRAVRLLGVLTEWAGVLAADALQALATALLTRHILPYLRASLERPRTDGTSLASGGLVHVLSACEKTALNMHPAWRKRDARGGRSACGEALHAFVAQGVSEAVLAADAEAGGPLRAKLAKLLATLDHPAS